MTSFIGSFSALNCYKTCPRQFYHRYIARDVPKATSEAIERGNVVHAAFEAAAKGEAPLEGEWECWNGVLERLKAGHTIAVELQLGITEPGMPCDFFADAVFFRGKLDLVLDRNVIIDWKTGKRRIPEDSFELACGAVLLHALAGGEALEVYSGFYVWLGAGVVGETHLLYPERTWREIRNLVHAIREKVAESGWWAMNPSGLCKAHCPVTSCKHNGGAK